MGGAVIGAPLFLFLLKGEGGVGGGGGETDVGEVGFREGLGVEGVGGFEGSLEGCLEVLCCLESRGGGGGVCGEIGFEVGHLCVARFHPFGFVELAGGVVEGFGQGGEVHIEEEGAVHEGAALGAPHGHAGEFAAIDKHVVGGAEGGGDAEGVEGVGEEGMYEGVGIVGVHEGGDDGEIEVAEVVIDGAAAGAPAVDADVILAAEGGVDFVFGELVGADDDSRAVLPEAEDVAVCKSRESQHKVIESQVEGRVGGGVEDLVEDHRY